MVASSAGRLAQVRARALFLAAFVSLPLGALAADLFSVGRFDIAAQPLQSAMVEFTAQSGVQVTSATELLQDKRSTDLRGEYTAYAALTQLLSGTDLGYRTVDSNTVAIVSLPMQQPVPDSNEALAGRVRENTAAPADSSDGGSEVDAELTEVTVTGSRIVRRGAAGPTPVTSVEASDLRVMAPTTLMAAINQMPQFVNNQTPETAGNVTSSNVGASYLNLRGLGVNRTLVLLDGRRIVSSTRRGPVDVSLLPESLLRSIEVTTGGGSAAYGSDAVSGVVNFLLDTEFTGVKAGLQGGITERGDNENLKASLAGGLALGERAHLIGSMEYYSSRLIPSITSRDWFAGWALVSNPLTGAGNPVRVLARDVHSRLFTYGGLITAGPLAGTTFLGNGQTGTLQPGTLVTANMQAGGGGEDTAEIGTMVPGLDRVSGFARVGYDLDGGHRVFLQALVGQSTTDFESPPAGMQLGTWAATIYRNNAYLPASVGAQMDAAGITSFRYGRAGDLDYGADKKVRHRNLLTSSTIGASGRLSGDWRYDAYYQYGRTNSRTTMFGALRLDRIYQAMDAVIDPVTGAIVCNSTLTFPGNGCVPMNTFGVGSPSPEAIAYVTHPRIDEVSRLQQHAADFTLQGEPFTTWAGPVAVAAGASYRRDAFTQRVYPVELHAGVDMPAADAMTGYRGLPAPYVGLPNIFERGMSSQADGSYDVWEVFGESLLPLAKNSFLAHSLELNTAVRYANYKGSGGIMAWKAGLDWAPVAGLRLRATRSRDVRAVGTLRRVPRAWRGDRSGERQQRAGDVRTDQRRQSERRSRTGRHPDFRCGLPAQVAAGFRTDVRPLRHRHHRCDRPAHHPGHREPVLCRRAGAVRIRHARFERRAADRREPVHQHREGDDARHGHRGVLRPQDRAVRRRSGIDQAAAAGQPHAGEFHRGEGGYTEDRPRRPDGPDRHRHARQLARLAAERQPVVLPWRIHDRRAGTLHLQRHVERDLHIGRRRPQSRQCRVLHEPARVLRQCAGQRDAVRDLRQRVERVRQGSAAGAAAVRPAGFVPDESRAVRHARPPVHAGRQPALLITAPDHSDSRILPSTFVALMSNAVSRLEIQPSLRSPMAVPETRRSLMRGSTISICSWEYRFTASTA
jgi:outer membrane receptor protein involved in Fe transport